MQRRCRALGEPRWRHGCTSTPSWCWRTARYELQIYDRVLTDIGIDIVFQRIVDGELVRQIKGSTVRVKS